MPATDKAQSLSAFIRHNHRDIIGEFSGFARTLMPPNSPMTEQELRDHCKELLIAIAEDLDTEQTSHEQSQKSRGRGSAKIMGVSGRLHGDGFTTDLPSFRCWPSFVPFARLSCDSTK
jgi:hypothetical protein